MKTVMQPLLYDKYNEYIISSNKQPLFICSDALSFLQNMPDETIDCCMTSPPYWGKRQYNGGGIGLEKSYNEYLDNLFDVFSEVKRVLKPVGSLWLNIGDAYQSKRLLGIPWRLAIRLIDEQKWSLRNDIIWNKIKGAPDNSKDKLRNIHEHIFHFVKNPKQYYYDVNKIRTKPSQAKVINGSVVSATGVSGVRYKRQIELSTSLSDNDKKAAINALNDMLNKIKLNEISDFRMIIRGQQRTTHSDSTKVSGRAKELNDKGFYFLKYHPNGAKPSDVWDIIPEDTHKRKSHFAPYPEDLCKIPILSTCPDNGIVLDPFCGTGTTMLVAKQLNRKSIGIDISQDYINSATERCNTLI